MPLVRIDLAQGKSPEYRRAIGDVVYRAMLETIGVPENDRFQIVTEHPSGELLYTPSYLGIRYSPDLVLIQVTLSAGRTVEKKQAFYRAIADGLHAAVGLDRQDVFINLVEVPKENWSFGNGVAQYV